MRTKLALKLNRLICVISALEQVGPFLSGGLLGSVTHILRKLCQSGFQRICLLESPALHSHRVILLFRARAIVRRQPEGRRHISYFLDKPLKELARSNPSDVMSRYSISA